MEAVEKANQQGPDILRIATSKEIDPALQSGAWEAIRDAFPLWTGTGSAYVEPDKTFREGAEKISSLGNRYYIICTDSRTNERWLFPVPEQHLDVRNGILVAEHPDFYLEKDGNDRILMATGIDLVGEFPAKSSNWYLPDPKHGIPHDKEVSPDDPNARYLWRLNKLISLVARGYRYGDYLRRSVGLYDGPSDGFGVAVVREKQTKLVFDGPTAYRSPPRLVGVGEDEKAGNGTQESGPETLDTKPEIQDTKIETRETECETQSSWWDKAKRLAGF